MAASLFAFLVCVMALGSCFPQISPAVADDPDRLSRWWVAVRDVYGDRTAFPLALGLFRLGHSPVLLVPSILVVVIGLACTLRRLPELWRQTRRPDALCPDEAFDTAPLLTKLAGADGLAAPVLAAERILRRRRFRPCSQLVGETMYLRGDRNRYSQLGTLATHLGVWLLLLGVLLSTTLAWRQIVSVGPGDVAASPHLGLSVRNQGVVLELDAAGRPIGTEARLSLLANGRVLWQGSVPASGGVRVSQMNILFMNYWGTAPNYGVVLQLVRDPGFVPFVLGGVLMALGIASVLYLPHCIVRVRFGPDGTVRLAAWSGRHTCGLRRDFAGIELELREIVQDLSMERLANRGDGTSDSPERAKCTIQDPRP